MGRHCSVQLAGCTPCTHQLSCKYFAAGEPLPLKYEIRLSNLEEKVFCEVRR
jgi:hypothetical protein